MRRRLRQAVRPLLILAGATWKEGLRRRLVLAGLVLTGAFIALYGLGVHFAFRSADDLGPFRELAVYQLLSFGVFVCSFLGSMLVVFSSAGMISGEIENGLMQPVAARPVSRWQILLGRYLGYASLFAVYLVIVTGGVLVLTRLLAGYSTPSPLTAVALLVAQGLILLGLVSLLSTTLAPVATGIAVFMAFGLSFIGGVVRQIGLLLSNPTAEAIGAAVTYLLPSDSFFRMALAELAPRGGNQLIENLGPFGVTLEPGLWPLAYGALYTVACLALAINVFARKDL